MNTGPGVAARLAALFAIDLRALALFRLCLGFILIADLATRAGALGAHYTDAGVWPRADAVASLPEFAYSLHLLGGSAWFQAALFLIAGLLALLLIVGYRTRAVSILCWFMLASLHHRNSLVVDAGDSLLLALLFWSMFVPLGARYAMDAALDQDRRGSNSVCSLASAALLVQVVSVYVFGALMHAGDQGATGPGTLQAALPQVVPGWLAGFTFYLSILGPVLLLLGAFTAKIRVVVLPLMLLLHLVFALRFGAGLYHAVSIVALLLFIPTPAWDASRARVSTPERAGLKIYFDAPCTFCRKVCLLLRTFLLLDTTPVRKAQDQPEIQELLEQHNSWVIEDFDGQRYVRWAAMIIVFRRSWLLAPVAGVFATAPLLAVGERFYGWVARNREQLGRFTSVLLPYRSPANRLPAPLNLAVGVLMLVVVYANSARVKPLELELPCALQYAMAALLLEQNWTLFALQSRQHTRSGSGCVADG